MSYALVVEGLHERVVTVLSEDHVLDYEPNSIQSTPTLYFLFDSSQDASAGQVRGTRYRVLGRLCMAWGQDNEQSEIEMIPYIDSIPATLLGVDGLGRPNAKLGGRIDSGEAKFAESRGGFASIGGTLYRITDFYFDVLDKG